MLILQLTISIGLIASVIIVFRQTSLLIDQRLGFNKNRLLEMALPDDESTAGKYRLLKDKYSGLPEVGGFGNAEVDTRQRDPAISAICRSQKVVNAA